jgi:predicted extracellular nuclease
MARSAVREVPVGPSALACACRALGPVLNSFLVSSNPKEVPMKRSTLGVIASALLLTAAPAHSSVFFSEYIEGSGNNKALEIFNGNGGILDLSAGGYFVDMYFNGSTMVGSSIGLTGTVAPGDVYVLTTSNADAAMLAVADQTSIVSFFNGDDAVVLRQGSTVVDVFGQIGVDPGASWGPPSTMDNTLVRLDTVFAGDTNGFDPFNPALQWRGFGQDYFAELGSPTLAAIPEPETYALLLAGLGLLGFAARRRRSGRVTA